MRLRMAFSNSKTQLWPKRYWYDTKALYVSRQFHVKRVGITMYQFTFYKNVLSIRHVPPVFTNARKQAQPPAPLFGHGSHPRCHPPVKPVL